MYVIPEGIDRNSLILCRKNIHIFIWQSKESLQRVICIEDPLREEAVEVIRELHERPDLAKLS